MIDVKSLFKSEGKHKGKVKVTRGGKTFYREQMLGQKEKIGKVQVRREKEMKEIKERGLKLQQEANEINEKIKVAKKNNDDVAQLKHETKFYQIRHEIDNLQAKLDIIKEKEKKSKTKKPKEDERSIYREDDSIELRNRRYLERLNQ